MGPVCWVSSPGQYSQKFWSLQHSHCDQKGRAQALGCFAAHVSSAHELHMIAMGTPLAGLQPEP